MAEGYKKWLTDINAVVYILIVIFNLASWIDLSCIYVELPLFVNRLPEGWELPSYMIIIISVCKMGLITYIVLKKILKEKLQDVPVVYFIIGSGAAFLLAAGFVWDQTMIINGAEHSVALMSLIAALSIVDCTSTAVFYPYMSRYSSQYITALFVGEGMCQIIPAIISFFQGVGEHPICMNETITIFNEATGINETGIKVKAVFPSPQFSVKAFFSFMFGVMICSGIAFTLLHFLPYCKKEQLDCHSQTHAKRKKANKDEMANTSHSNGIKEEELEMFSPKERYESDEVNLDDQMLGNENRSSEENVMTGKEHYINGHKEAGTTENMLDTHRRENVEEVIGAVQVTIQRWEYIYLIFLMAWDFCLMYGVVPALHPYSSLPYGSRAYTLSIRLGVAMTPLASIVALFLPTRSYVKITVFAVLGSICSVYMVAFACLSPDPPMKGTPAGEALIVLFYVLLMAFFNYDRSCIMYILKEKAGADGLLWGGVAMHVGVTAGSIVTFILTSIAKVFESEKPCPGM